MASGKAFGVAAALGVGFLLLSGKGKAEEKKQPAFNPGDILGPGGPTFPPAPVPETTTVSVPEVTTPDPGQDFFAGPGADGTSHALDGVPGSQIEAGQPGTGPTMHGADALSDDDDPNFFLA